jgi:hypothetical protein
MQNGNLTGIKIDPNAEWLSRDPIQENGGINLYDYVGDNPVDRVDPMGTSSIGLYGQGTAFGLGPFGVRVKLSVVYDFCQHKYSATCSICGIVGAGTPTGSAGLGGAREHNKFPYSEWQ